MSNHVIDPSLATYAPLPPPSHGEQKRTPPRHANPHQPPPYPPPQNRAEAAAYQNAHNPQPYYYHPPPALTPQQQQQHIPATPQYPASHSVSPNVAYHDPPSDQHDGSPDEHDGGATDGANGDDPKRPRACEACRGLKVRCDQDPTHPDVPCKRCAKAGRPCIITQPSRKRQKKADSRVAELEKKLDALTAALHQSQGSNAFMQAGAGAPMAESMTQQNGSGGQYSQAFDDSPVDGDGSGAVKQPSRKRQRLDDNVERLEHEAAVMDAHLSRATSTSNADDPVRKHFTEIENSWAPTEDSKRFLHHTTPEEFIARVNSFINPELAATIFNRYITTLSPHLPAVVFPPDTTAEQVFKDKPILYVSILSAASFGTLHQDTSKALAREAVGAIADCVVRNGAKSLELIQAMQVMALWYKPPEKAEQTNFYQIIHMAAVMALDIGLGKRFNPTKARRGFGGPKHLCRDKTQSTFEGVGGLIRNPQDSDTVEARRAWLGCYYLCASASMVLRRPNLVRWTNYMKECIEVLESHPDAYESDKLFCQHVKIQRICEDIGLQFLMDDNTATISITDPKVSYALNVLENQLKDWKMQVPESCKGPGLQFFEHVTSLYLHEIALHFNHNIEDFRLPFTEESLKSVTSTTDTLTQGQMAALEACKMAAHGILETMLAYELEVIKSLPMLLFFVRCVYAIVILIKMHVAVCTPNSELGKVMKPEHLRVEHYIDCLITLFGHVAKEGEDFRPHPKILRILTVLRDWFGKHKENVAAQQAALAAQGGPRKAAPTTRKPADGDGKMISVREQERRRQSQRLGTQDDQTPLHLLSQAATQQAPQQPQPPQQQRQTQGAGGSGVESTDWNFGAPLIDYSRPPPPGHPDNRYPRWTTASGSASTAQPTPEQQAQYQPMDPQQQQQQQMVMAGMPVDPTNMNPDYGWGSGFEQAMDIALGGVDGLQGGGLDNWFLGDGMAPFGFGPGGGGMGMGMGDMGGGQW